MKRVRLAPYGLLIGVLVGSLMPGFVGIAVSKEQSAKKKDPVLFPPDHAVLISGIFDVIANGPEGALQVDGERSEERRVGKECRSRWSPDS